MGQGIITVLNISRKHTGLLWHLVYLKSTTTPATFLSYPSLIHPVWEQIYHILHNIDPFAFVSQLEKNTKAISGPGIFFICQIEGESFGFAIFTTNWLSCSRLLMTPRNFSWVLVLLDSCLCCYSPSLLGHPPHWALAAGSSAWGMAAGSRTKMSSCLWCYSYLKPVLLVLLCLQLNTKADFISSLFQDEKYSQY